MNKRSFFQDVAYAYSLPFRKEGLKAFLFSCLFMLIPITAFIGEGAAYSVAAGRKEGIGGWAKLGLKLIAVQIMYAAPAVAAYGLYSILATYLYLGLVYQFILLFLLVLCSARALVLIPVASCAVAMGAPLKIAINGKEMNSIISGSMGRYLLSGIMCLLMLIIFDLPMQGEWLIVLQYILASIFVVLYRFFKAGLFMGVVRHSLGIAPPSEYRKSNGARIGKMVISAVLCVALIGNSSLSVFATGFDDENGFINYYRPEDEEPQPIEPPGLEDVRNWNRRPIQESTGKDLNLLFNFAGDVCNVTPVVSNIKNGIQAIYYYYKGVTTTDEEQKKVYFANSLYKTVGIITGPLTTWGAKVLQFYDKAMSWLGFSDDIFGTKTDEYFGPVKIILKINDLMNDTLNKAEEYFKRADIALGDFIEYTKRRVAEGTDWWLTEPQPLPGQSELFIDNPNNPLNTSYDKNNYAVSEGSLDLDALDVAANAEEEDPIADKPEYDSGENSSGSNDGRRVNNDKTAEDNSGDKDEIDDGISADWEGDNLGQQENIFDCPTAMELAGSYDNGVITLREYYIPPELQKDEEDGDDGCDFDIDEYIGKPNAFPFTLAYSDPTTLIFSSSKVSPVSGTYSPYTGLLVIPSFTMEQDGTKIIVSISFNHCAFTDESHTAVEVSGTVLYEFTGEYKGAYIIADLSGSRQLQPAETETTATEEGDEEEGDG
ncbi:MAG: hypothetical protein K5779_05350 [Saccharofermentans sp.]|nr:hypothetical protein [Saccharofermentans sp.]